MPYKSVVKASMEPGAKQLIANADTAEQWYPLAEALRTRKEEHILAKERQLAKGPAFTA